MTKGIKVKLGQLYAVSAAEPNFIEYTRPAIEVYAADSAVTIRATTNPDFRGDYDELPLVVDNAVAGDVFVTEAGRAVAYISIDCDDADAEVYVTGFKMLEAPVFAVESFEMSDAGSGYKLNEQVSYSAEGDECPVVFKIAEISDGVISDVTIEDAGFSETDYSAEEFEVPGGKVNAKISFTTTADTSFYVTEAEIVAGGADYVADDLLDIEGSEGDIMAQIKVVAVDENGSITEAELYGSGKYASDVSGEGVSVTGGTGSGATADITATEATFYSLDSASIASAGEGYEDEEFNVVLPDEGGEISLTAVSGVVKAVVLVEDGKLLTDISEIEPEGSGEGLTISVTTKKLY